MNRLVASARLFSLVRRARDERTGAGGAAAVFVVCALVSWLGWIPLAVPARLLGGFVPAGNCTGLTPGGIPMYFCSAKVALLVIVGPLLVLAIAIVLRKPLIALVMRGVARLPEDARYLAPPVVATAFFVVSWAHVHASTGAQTGILPQTLFPAVVGVFTYVVTRFGPALQRSLAAFFARRDGYPPAARYAAAVGIPLLVSLVITNQARVSETAMKEQVVVLIGLVTGYLALAPRSGDLLASVQRQLALRARR